jgi:hypothetical protein
MHETIPDQLQPGIKKRFGCNTTIGLLIKELVSIHWHDLEFDKTALGTSDARTIISVSV